LKLWKVWRGKKMGKVLKVGPLEYEARVLNALTEPTARNRAIRKLREYQDGRGWLYSEETGKFNDVPDEEGFDRDLFLDLVSKLIAILASDKKGVAGQVEDLLKLAESDADSFNKLYAAAIEANPSLTEKQDAANDPNS
jgi:hypothetical protein